MQALLKIKEPLLIQVVSRSKTSTKLGQNRVKEVSVDKANIRVEWHNSFEGLKAADLCIVATFATNRAETILKLLNYGNRRFLIEKVVCQSDDEYLTLLKAFNKEDSKGWVNCNRRYNPFYIRLKDILKENETLVLKVTGGNYGLGCNAIHYLDLFGFLTGSCKIELDGKYLDDKAYQNRRSNELVEFCGTLIGSTMNNSILDLTFAGISKGSCTVSILGEGISCFIDEVKEKAQVALESNDWKWNSWDYKNLYVSQITADIATKIINNDNCSLVSLEESYDYHRPLFDVFNRHIEKITGTFSGICPIT